MAAVEALDVVEVGDVSIALSNRNVWTLEQVKHVPNLKKSLISVGKLDDSSYTVAFLGGVWKVTQRVHGS